MSRVWSRLPGRVHLNGERVGWIARRERVEQRLAPGCDDDHDSVVAPIGNRLVDQLGAGDPLRAQERDIVLDSLKLSRAVMVGLANAVKEMLRLMENYGK